MAGTSFLVSPHAFVIMIFEDDIEHQQELVSKLDKNEHGGPSAKVWLSESDLGLVMRFVNRPEAIRLS